MKTKYILCDGEGCPLKEKCTKYCPDMDKTKTNHFDPIPYLPHSQSCFYFEEDNHLKELGLTSNYEEPREPYPGK